MFHNMNTGRVDISTWASVQLKFTVWPIMIMVTTDRDLIIIAIIGHDLIIAIIDHDLISANSDHSLITIIIRPQPFLYKAQSGDSPIYSYGHIMYILQVPPVHIH